MKHEPVRIVPVSNMMIICFGDPIGVQEYIAIITFLLILLQWHNYSVYAPDSQEITGVLLCQK